MELHPASRVEDGGYRNMRISDGSIVQDAGGPTVQMFTELSAEWTHPNLLMFAKVSSQGVGRCKNV